jgi:hypothetical protein
VVQPPSQLAPPPTFVFFFVGEDVGQPQVLVNSIRRVHPSATVIQCSDTHTSTVHGVDRVHRSGHATDSSRLMLERVEAFAELGLHEPAIYLDTDIIWLSPIDTNSLLGSSPALLCRRSFYADSLFKTPKSHGEVFTELSGKTVDEIFPILACCTLADYTFWQLIKKVMLSLPSRYLVWYGDQEALREVWLKNQGQFSTLPEKKLACLPEFFKPNSDMPYSVHFKGPSRKSQMFEAGRLLGIV